MKNAVTLRTDKILLQTAPSLLAWADAFLQDRRAQNLSEGTLEFYHGKLKNFLTFCEAQGIQEVTDITAPILREFLLYLDASNHTPGGVHAHYRTVRAFLLWYAKEAEPEGWSNPIKKVKAPKVAIDPLDPANLEDVSKMLDTCKPAGKFHNDRDRALIMSLLDTGARASELLALNLEDVDMMTGAAIIRHGKGGKSRTVYLGAKSRKAIRRYLNHNRQAGKSESLFCSDEGTRLTYDGLREVIRHRAELAGVEPPELHSFRRAFAIGMLRAGCDIFTLQDLMGHSSLAVMNRYLKIAKTDTKKAHTAAGIVDRL